MKASLLLLSALVLTGCLDRDVASVIDPRDAPPINKPVTKPIIIRKKKRIMVAVIDTGLDPALMNKNYICPEGHKDFTGGGLVDNHGHGTHISGIIDQYAKNYVYGPGKRPSDIFDKEADYCQIIVKYYDPKRTGQDNLKNTIKSFRWAIDQKVDIINYSGGGTEYSQAEHDLVIEALNKGIKVVAAAGNERSNIDQRKYYPAMYDNRIYRVGNVVRFIVTTEVVKRLNVSNNKMESVKINKTERDVASSSNYGDGVNNWEVGTNVMSTLPGNSYGYMTGTSQAAAVKSGKLVNEMLSSK